ncbi:uncharacterized protein LOC123292190 [Chrysoperla carnea]|uniref:uncharacterized protein LOC123292190 n=1 Tax=Chrysoperla carnea TaxID=189513 RepID=UPI001D08A3FB|nr:uncharacterized protein LOC123292190 [Chrysoperla carnea]
MAHGLNTVVIKRNNNQHPKTEGGSTKGIGSRRIFAPQFKLQVLDSYRNDADCKGNQRATARKYGIHRRQIQKWLQVETNLRNSVLKIKNSSGSTNATSPPTSSTTSNGIISSTSVASQQVLKVNPDVNNMKCVSDVALSVHRLQDDTSPIVYSQQHMNNSSEHTRHIPHMHEQRVPYINIPQARSPIVYSQQPTSVNTTTTLVVSTAPVPVCISPEVHRVPSSTGSPPCLSLAATTPYNHHVLIDESQTRCLPDTNTTALDFSTHALSHYRQEYLDEESYMYEPPRYHPIDLSVKKCCSCPSPTSQYLYPPYPAPPSLPTPTYYTQVSPGAELHHLRTDSEYEIWDLSMKNKPSLKRKIDEVVTSSNDDKNTVPPPAKKPVKLFKPYLDDDDYCSSSSSSEGRSSISSTIMKNEIPYEAMLKKEGEIIYDYRYVNNNVEYYHSYEYLPRTSDIEYFNNNNLNIKSNHNYNDNIIVQTSSPPPPPSAVPEHVNTTNNVGSTIKQRQSYSLNFKLSAIECYYNDDTCRGNQRAVASKYKIHRRQVQKWLKQEQELRDRFQSANEIQVS